jgi:hypothetical protein
VTEPESPLDRRLLVALRSQRPVPGDVRARVRARLETAIPEMRRGPAGGDGGAGTGSGAARSLGAFGAPTVGIAAFILGGVTGAALFAVLSRTAPPRIVYVDRPVAPIAAAAVNPPAVTSAPIATALVVSKENRPAAAAQAAIARMSPVTSAARMGPMAPAGSAQAGTRPLSGHHPSGLTEERMLLDEARAGLIQGEADRALERLELHRARFAEGQLNEERDAMLVEALVLAGRYDEARQHAGAFQTQSPSSLFLPTVESAIAKIP